MHASGSVPLSVTIPAVVGLKGAPAATHAGSPIAAASLGTKVQQHAKHRSSPQPMPNLDETVQANPQPMPNLAETVQACPPRHFSSASLLANAPRQSQPVHESSAYEYDQRSSFGSEGEWHQHRPPHAHRRGSHNSMVGSACGGYAGSDYAVQNNAQRGIGRSSLAGSAFGDTPPKHPAATSIGVTQVVNQVQAPHPQRMELADALGVTMPVQDVDDTPQRLQWQVGSILEAFSESQGRWYVGQVTHVAAPPDSEALLVQFYVDDIPKKKGMFRHDRRNLAPLGSNTKGELPPGFEVRPSKSRPGRCVLLDATTGNKYDSVELAWRVHFNRLQQSAPPAGQANRGRGGGTLQHPRQSGPAPQYCESHSFDLANPYMAPAPMPTMVPYRGPMPQQPTKPPRTAFV